MSNPVIETPEVLTIGLSMLIIVGTVLGLGWLYSRARLGTGGAGHMIDIVASRGIGAKERLMLIEVGDKQLLVGVTAQSMTTLHTFDEPLAAGKSVAELSGFAGRLKAALSGTGR